MVKCDPTLTEGMEIYFSFTIVRRGGFGCFGSGGVCGGGGDREKNIKNSILHYSAC